VKKTRTISTTLTEEEFETFRDAWLDHENLTGDRISVSQFLRHTVLQSINGSVPNPDIKPPAYDTVSEGGYKPTKENVSPDPPDTISKSYEFNLD
jgi:hypothetical protein